MEWPGWWTWELELTPHVERRMVDRDFTEIDLRTMLEHASGYQRDFVVGRWVIHTRHGGSAWRVIVEPAPGSRRLTIITAYPADTQE